MDNERINKFIESNRVREFIRENVDIKDLPPLIINSLFVLEIEHANLQRGMKIIMDEFYKNEKSIIDQ